MRMVFSAAEKAGWLGEGQKRLDFMGFGLVQGQDGPAAFQKGKREKATIAISGNQTDIVGAGGAQFDFRNVSHLQPLGSHLLRQPLGSHLQPLGASVCEWLPSGCLSKWLPSGCQVAA